MQVVTTPGTNTQQAAALVRRRTSADLLLAVVLYTLSAAQYKLLMTSNCLGRRPHKKTWLLMCTTRKDPTSQFKVPFLTLHNIHKQNVKNVGAIGPGAAT